MLFGVVGQVASLAHGKQVLVTVVLGRVVKVRCRQHDFGTSNRMRLSVDRTAPPGVYFALATALADATGTLKAYSVGNLFPVIRVSALIFRLYRHWHPKVYVSAPRS